MTLDELHRLEAYMVMKRLQATLESARAFVSLHAAIERDNTKAKQLLSSLDEAFYDAGEVLRDLEKAITQ